MKIFNFLLVLLLNIDCSTSLALELSPSGIKSAKPYRTQNLLDSYMNIVSLRHKILGENIANLNTPGYKANEVTMPSSTKELASANSLKRIALKTTSSKHISGNIKNNHYYAVHKLKDPLEIKKNGNNVSLAQQINKASQNQTAYDTGLKISASLNSLITTALGK